MKYVKAVLKVLLTWAIGNAVAFGFWWLICDCYGIPFHWSAALNLGTILFLSGFSFWGLRREEE